MFGFSKKRFFVTLGLAVVVWVGSVGINFYLEASNLFNLTGSCSLTGYPISLCVSSYNDFKFYSLILLNILIWFWVLNLALGIFNKRKS